MWFVDLALKIPLNRPKKSRGCAPAPLTPGLIRGVPKSCPRAHVWILPSPSRPTFAFLRGARLGKKLANDGVFQEKAEISVCRAMLVTEGVHRAPSLQRFSRESPFRGQRPCVAYGRLNDMLVVV